MPKHHKRPSATKTKPHTKSLKKAHRPKSKKTAQRKRPSHTRRDDEGDHEFR